MDKSVGPMCNPRLCLAAADERINYSFQVFFKSIATGSCTLDDLSQIERYLVQLSNKSGFLVCPGISEYPSSIRFKTKISEGYRCRQTSYVLQTLWRDFTSHFDVVGPHYTSDSTFSHDKLCPILYSSFISMGSRLWL